MSAEKELYQQVILDHNKNPRHWGPLPDATHHAQGDNPLCGDRYDVYLVVDQDGRISKVSFAGAGCAISKASASLMTESVMGKTVAEANLLFERFHQLIRGESRSVGELGKLRVFSGIWEFPARVKCAILCWHAMRSALGGSGAVTTEETDREDAGGSGG